MTGAQRAKLRAMANGIEPVVHIGKDELSDNILTQADQALTARELIKCTILRTCDTPARELADGMAKSLGAECIQVIGRRFVLYRPSPDEPKITL